MKYLVMLVALLVGCDSGSSDDPGASDTGPGGMDPDMMAVEEAPPVGAAFFVDSESGEWLQPLGAERFLALAPEGLSLWLTVDAVAAGSLDFMLAVGGAEAQDRCIRTILMEPVELPLFGPVGSPRGSGTSKWAGVTWRNPQVGWWNLVEPPNVLVEPGGASKWAGGTWSNN